MYVVLALVMLLRGFVDALDDARAAGDRRQFATAICRPTISTRSSPRTARSWSSSWRMPFLSGLINFIVPLQIGARDVAFPFLNAISLWLTARGAALVMVSLVIGVFSTAGWTGYPPYSELSYSPGVGVDYWIWALLISRASARR